jgi:hypothetical protein
MQQTYIEQQRQQQALAAFVDKARRERCTIRVEQGVYRSPTSTRLGYRHIKLAAVRDGEPVIERFFAEAGE